MAQAALLSRKAEIAVIPTETPDLSGADSDFSQYLTEQTLQRMLQPDEAAAFCGADAVVIASRVYYDAELNHYDTLEVEKYLSLALRYAKDAEIILRSDVPVGFTQRMNARLDRPRIRYSPDFAREGRAFYDSFHPARIIVGETGEAGQRIASLFCPEGVQPEILLMGATEAESVKLFANSYLAMRVAFFNELDTFAALRGLQAEQIIRGVSSDPRVGDLYNNPSFGYGGRYLTEGTAKLKANFMGVPQKIAGMVEDANEVRKDFIAQSILKQSPKTVGIFRMNIKTGSKDFRYSSVEGVMKRLQAGGVKVLVYEPMIRLDRFLSAEVLHDLPQFKKECDLILANRMDDALADVADKVFTRDLFRRD